MDNRTGRPRQVSEELCPAPPLASGGLVLLAEELCPAAPLVVPFLEVGLRAPEPDDS